MLSNSNTVEHGDSKPVDSKLQELVNFLPVTKIGNHSINHMIDSKHLAIVNIFCFSKSLLKPGSTVLRQHILFPIVCLILGCYP